jgi:hypothetical protein
LSGSLKLVVRRDTYDLTRRSRRAVHGFLDRIPADLTLPQSRTSFRLRLDAIP